MPGERNVHEYYMRMALSIARRGTGYVSPNPRVGCVIVDFADPRGRVVSLGWHKKYGGSHAETNALAAAKEPTAGMTAYVTLEPCCHAGHTPPCCYALIDAGISRVVIGMSDPDPRVSGGGVARLASAGVEIVDNILGDESASLNRGFVKRVTRGRPWVTVKAAVSLDGDIALADGESKWITGAPARSRAHLMRAESDVIIAGAGTVIKDNPALSVRDSDGRSPMKAVVDKNLDIPLNSRALEGGCVIFAGRGADAEKKSALENADSRVICLDTDRCGHIPPGTILKELASMGANYVMLEGGGRLISSFLSSGEADEIALFIAPKLMGLGIGVTGGLSLKTMDCAIHVNNLMLKQAGGDILARGLIAKGSAPCSQA